MISFLVVLYFLIGLFFGLSGIFVYWFIGRTDLMFAMCKNEADRVKLRGNLKKFSEARKKMLPWIILAFVAWPINVINGLIRRALKKRKAAN